MTSLQSIMCFAYVSSWARSIVWLPKRFPETNSLIDILTTSASDMGTVGYSLQQALPSEFTLSNLSI